MTLDARGEIESGGERFIGNITGHSDRAGTLTLTSVSTGTVCIGDYLYTTTSDAKGNITCGDGRSGPFEFHSSGFHGTGSGQLGDRRFTFSFG